MYQAQQSGIFVSPGSISMTAALGMLEAASAVFGVLEVVWVRPALRSAEVLSSSSPRASVFCAASTAVAASSLYSVQTAGIQWEEWQGEEQSRLIDAR